MEGQDFENPEDRRLSRSHSDDMGGEILGSKVNGQPQPTDGESPFGTFDAPDGPVPF